MASFKSAHHGNSETPPTCLIWFWLRHLRLETIDIFQKLSLFHLFHCQLCQLFLHKIQIPGTDLKSAHHEESKTVIYF